MAGEVSSDPAVSPLKRMTDDELLKVLDTVRPDMSFAEIVKLEMQIRLADRHVKAAAESTKLANRLWWLNVWLLIVTVALSALTIAQILIALKVIGR